MPLGLVRGRSLAGGRSCLPASLQTRALTSCTKMRNGQLRKQTVQILSRGVSTPVFGTQIFRNMGWRSRFCLFSCAVTSQPIRVFYGFRGVCRFSLSLCVLLFILMFRGVIVCVCISRVRSCALRSFVISRGRGFLPRE